MSQPSSPTKPKRRDSLKEQWDTTTKVVNVKQKFHSNAADKYTELQKATFTKWVNIQLRMIDINQLSNSSSASKKVKIPEIKAIDKDFRDGKKLIQLLEILYPNDSELPKLERGKTRHHYIANINKVLEFLQKRLDEKSSIALKAIGPVDIVDGNVKLTLGLIWLTISKFLQIFSVQFEVTEEELEEVEERFKENINNKKGKNTIKHNDIQKFLFHNGDVNDISFEEFQQQFRSHFVEGLLNDSTTIYEEVNTYSVESSYDHSTQETFEKDYLQDSSTQNKTSHPPSLSQIAISNDHPIPSLPPPLPQSTISNDHPIPSLPPPPPPQITISNDHPILSLPPPLPQSTISNDHPIPSLPPPPPQITISNDHPIPSPPPPLPQSTISNDHPIPSLPPPPPPPPPQITISNDHPILSLPPSMAALPTLPNKRLQNLSKSEKRLSLPIFQSNNNNLTENINCKVNDSSPNQFRTLRLSSSPINSNTSNLLFWINMQLIDYASILPSSNYPLEDFVGLNDGIVLAALIQYLNIEWQMGDLNLLNAEDIDNEFINTENLNQEELYERELYKEIKAKERLSKCFDIIEKKLNIRRQKALISMLIEKDYSDKERLKRTGLAWSVYMSEIFLAITKSRKQRKEMKRRSRLLMLNNAEDNKEGREKEKPKEHIISIIDYDSKYYQYPNNGNQKKHKKSRGCLPFFYASDEEDSFFSMIWDWTLNWLLNEDDDDDDGDMDLFFGA